VIRVSVSPASVSEGSNATFSVSTSVVSPQPITVNYSLGGSAQFGADYTGPAGNQVVIPAGQSSVAIPVHAIADHVAERKETVTLSLQSGAGYKLPRSAKATLTIINAP
jgi:hypothetical protein